MIHIGGEVPPPQKLYQPVEEWGLKFNPKGEQSLPGEKKVRSSAVTSAEPALIDCERFSDINNVIWAVARLLNIAQTKGFSGGMITSISTQQLKEAEKFIVKDVQRSLVNDLKKTDRKGRIGGRYASLNHVDNKDGLWLVGLWTAPSTQQSYDSRFLLTEAIATPTPYNKAVHASCS